MQNEMPQTPKRCSISIAASDAENTRFELCLYGGSRDKSVEGNAYGANICDTLHIDVTARPHGMSDRMALRILAAVFQDLYPELGEFSSDTEVEINLERWLGAELSQRDFGYAMDVLNRVDSATETPGAPDLAMTLAAAAPGWHLAFCWIEEPSHDGRRCQMDLFWITPQTRLKLSVIVVVCDNEPNRIAQVLQDDFLLTPAPRWWLVLMFMNRFRKDFVMSGCATFVTPVNIDNWFDNNGTRASRRVLGRMRIALRTFSDAVV